MLYNSKFANCLRIVTHRMRSTVNRGDDDVKGEFNRPKQLCGINNYIILCRCHVLNVCSYGVFVYLNIWFSKTLWNIYIIHLLFLCPVSRGVRGRLQPHARHIHDISVNTYFGDRPLKSSLRYNIVFYYNLLSIQSTL